MTIARTAADSTPATLPSRTRTSQADERLALFAALALGLVAILLLRLLEGAFDIDDAPITYRYARNIASGLGYVYNAGEYVQGTSTPLYTLILALLALLGAPPHWSSWAINLLASGGVVALVFLTAHRVSPQRWLAGLLAVLWLMLQGNFLRFTTTGMETPFYMLLIVGALYALAIKRFTWATVLAALALLTRLDGAAIGVAVLLSIWLQTGRFPLRFGILYGALILPWFAWAWWYFGHPLPNSMHAKQLHVEATHVPRTWMLEELFSLNSSVMRWPIALALPGAAQIYGRMRAVGWVAAPVVWLVLYIAAYTAVGIDYYEWYLSPLSPVLAILVGSGFAALWPLINHPVQRAPMRQAARTAIAVTLFLAMLLFLGAPQWRGVRDSYNEWQQYLTHVEGNRVRTGQWLRDHADPASIVASGAIGHVGYESGLRIIDTAGLITPLGYGTQENADYIARELTPSGLDCGTLAEFIIDRESHYTYPGVLSECKTPPIAQVGPLTIQRWRIADRIYNGHMQPLMSQPPSLEIQWKIADAAGLSALEGEWQVYVHMTDAEGNTIAQVDHGLGRSYDGYISPVSTWDLEEIVYTYAELPEEWAEMAPEVDAFRIGIWNPATGDRLTFASDALAIDADGSLVLPLASITSDQRFADHRSYDD